MFAGPDELAPPAVSVVVCTRDRPEDLIVAIRSILACEHDSFEVIVVDQSHTPVGTDPLWKDPRVRRIRSNTKGLSRARNEGIRQCNAAIALMTDDDCTVPTSWIVDMVTALAQSGAPQLVFGSVIAAPFSWLDGFVPDGPITREGVVRSVVDYRPGEGIGANMAVVVSTIREVGGFDPLLGAGAPFKSAEEVDLTVRLLLRGHSIATVDAAPVLHHGFRTHDQGRRLVRGYMLGTAAAYTKLVRSGSIRVLVPFARAVWVCLVPIAVDSIRKRRLPPVLGRCEYLARGTWRALRLPIDRRTRCFVDPVGGGYAGPDAA